MTIQANFPAIKPSLLLDFANTKQLDSRITYTRASTASFYNGVTTAMAEQNLYYPSNTLNGGNFVNRRVTLTGNSTVAPDGTTTASLLAEDTNTNSHGIDGLAGFTSGTSYTKSVFAKKGTGATAPDIIQISVSASSLTGGGYVNFNISSGTITANSANATGSIVSVGSGWYRCALTYTATATISPFNESLVYFTNNNSTATLQPSYAGVTTADVFLWGAQIEARSSATAYTATTTQAITNYIPVLQTAASGVARFDNNPTTGESLGLLIEESRTNLFTYSDDFNNASWSKTNSTVTADTIVSPDGTLTGEKLVETTTATVNHYVRQTATPSAGLLLGSWPSCVAAVPAINQQPCLPLTSSRWPTMAALYSSCRSRASASCWAEAL
jgi:hypothetical protein